jgi:hypothetical protein
MKGGRGSSHDDRHPTSDDVDHRGEGGGGATSIIGVKGGGGGDECDDDECDDDECTDVLQCHTDR